MERFASGGPREVQGRVQARRRLTAEKTFDPYPSIPCAVALYYGMEKNLKDDPPERLVTDREFAEQASISRRFVHTLRARGQLRAVKLGGALRFPLYENLARVLGTGDDGEKGGRAA